MTGYERVSKVWDDLESEYTLKGAKESRTDFLKKLLLFQGGEASFRKIILVISSDREGATDDQVQALIHKITTAREKLAKNPDAMIEDLNVFVGNTTNESAHVVNYLTAGLTEKRVTINDLLKDDRLCPVKAINKKKGSKIVKEVVQDYYAICMNRVELMNTIDLCFGRLLPIKKCIEHFTQRKELQLPLIITNTETVNTMLGYSCIKVKYVDNFTLEGKQHRLYIVSDKYMTYSLIEVDL